MTPSAERHSGSPSERFEDAQAIFTGDDGAPAWPVRRGRSYHREFQELRAALGESPVFDLKMAQGFNIPPYVVHHHRRRGRLWTMGRGLFRFVDQGLPDYIESARIMAHHLGADSIASHVTALSVFECTDIVPTRWEFIVPRSKRYIARRGLRIHTTKHPLPPEDVIEVRGLRVTTPARSIVDATKTIGDVYQIEIAIYQAIVNGLLHPEDLYARRREAGNDWWPIESGLRKYAKLAKSA